jgi:hypothetical protein
MPTEDANPCRSPTTPRASFGDKRTSRRWRIAGSGLLVFTGVSFLLFLNGQVFSDTFVFLVLCLVSLLLWIRLRNRAAGRQGFGDIRSVSQMVEWLYGTLRRTRCFFHRTCGDGPVPRHHLRDYQRHGVCAFRRGRDDQGLRCAVYGR